jgi:hypothetical protein
MLSRFSVNDETRFAVPLGTLECSLSAVHRFETFSKFYVRLHLRFATSSEDELFRVILPKQLSCKFNVKI